MTTRSATGLLLVTGASGFVGAETVQEAIRSGLPVRALARTPGRLCQCVGLAPGDIRDTEAVSAAMAGVDRVIHAAGLAHVFGRGRQDANRFTAVNEVGTANVASAAAQAGVRHFVLVSSVSVYGAGSGHARDESAGCHPQGAYARSKLAAERRATEIARSSGMHLTILRLATVYGEGDPGNVARLIGAIDRRRFVWVGNGSNLKSLIYREDAARACVAAALAPDIQGTYNVTDQPHTMSEVVTTIAALLGRRIAPLRLPVPPALRLARLAALAPGVSRYANGLASTLEKWTTDDAYDGTAFRRGFGFDCAVSLAEGLSREVRWYRARLAR